MAKCPICLRLAVVPTGFYSSTAICRPGGVVLRGNRLVNTADEGTCSSLPAIDAAVRERMQQAEWERQLAEGIRLD